MRVIAVVLWVAAACVSAVAAESYDNPFAYCAAVGTIDAPDARFSGPAIPAAVMRGLQKAIDAPPDAPPLPGVVWRCMDGKVYACTVGANLPCTAKADLNRAPAEPLRAFCMQQPDADVIQAYVTGRETVRGTWYAPADILELARAAGFGNARTEALPFETGYEGETFALIATA